MAHIFRQTILVLATLFTLLSAGSSAQAGWGHHHVGWGGHWGHHHHWGYRPFYSAWGWPAYRSYSSLYIGVPRYRYYSYYPSYYYPSYSVSYYAPTVSYSVALPTYYYAPSYCAPTTYVAPISTYQYCDPCASNYSIDGYSTDNYSPGIPISRPTTYSTGIAPRQNLSIASPRLASASVAGASVSFVDRMLATRTSSPAAVPSPLAVRTVSTAKPVVSVATTRVSSGQVLEAIPAELLDTADQIFAEGGYHQAAAAYARLAVRYGNHQELAVRRFIALVASGDHNQAAVVFELAQVNGQPLTSEALPGNGLAHFYGALASNKNNHTEALASFAMKNSTDSVSLAMVGKWLELDNQPERAAVFTKRAAQLNADSPTVDSANSSGTLAWFIPKAE